MLPALAAIPLVWRIGAGLAAVAAIGAGLWWLNAGWCNGACQAERERLQAAISEAASAYVENLEAAYAKAADEQAAKTEIVLKHAGRIADQRAATEVLRRQLARERAVTRPEPTDENPHPDVRLSAGWLQCWSAVASGDPADTAACALRGDDVPVERDGDGAAGVPVPR